MQRYFLRMGSDPIDNAKTVIDFVSLQLQQKKQQLDQQLGIPCRPWALVFASQLALFEGAIEPLRQDRDFWEHRQWLDGIRVCQVTSVHELRAVLCALHLKGEAPAQQEQQQEDIVTWMENAHDGQPPCLVVVMDLLQLLSSSSGAAQRSDGHRLQRHHQHQAQPPHNRDREDYENNDSCIQVRQDELSNVLALLVEACHYLTIYKRKTWDEAFGCHTGMTTDLLITDSQYIADPPLLGLPDQRSRIIDRLYRILSYFVDSVNIQSSE